MNKNQDSSFTYISYFLYLTSSSIKICFLSTLYIYIYAYGKTCNLIIYSHGFPHMLVITKLIDWLIDLISLGLHPQHLEVPRLGLNWSCSRQPTPQPQHHIQATSVTCTRAHGNAGSLTHWASPGIKHTSSWILVRFVTAGPPWELPKFIFPPQTLHSWPEYPMTCWIFIPGRATYWMFLPGRAFDWTCLKPISSYLTPTKPIASLTFLFLAISLTIHSGTQLGCWKTFELYSFPLFPWPNSHVLPTSQGLSIPTATASVCVTTTFHLDIAVVSQIPFSGLHNCLSTAFFLYCLFVGKSVHFWIQV